jgi:N-acetylmuramoyl-L-alanine amidase
VRLRPDGAGLVGAGRGVGARTRMSARVFLAAGHELGGGAGANGLRESPYNLEVALLAGRELRGRGIEAWVAPVTRRCGADEIHAKVAWVNARAEPDDLAVDVHLDINDPGCAAFAIDRPRDLADADTLAAEISRASGLGCRGGMPERETAVGRLGFLHGTRCRAVLVELCSMNTADARFAQRSGARARFGRGLAAGCAEVLAAGGDA